jgi:hypothetical protein
MGWSVKLFYLRALREGIVLIVVEESYFENQRRLLRVEKEDWDFR